MTEIKDKVTGKIFFNNLLNGAAMGIVVALIPHAVLSALVTSFFPEGNFTTTLHQVLTMYQFSAPLIIGALIALQFKFSPLHTAIVAGAAFVGAGNVTMQVIEDAAGDVLFAGYQIAGIGDIINTMLTAAIAVALIMWLGNKLGSLAIVLGPIIMGTGAGLIGRLTLPYVSEITTQIGNAINQFTTLQPLLMSILIGISFAFIILSPLSTVGIAMAIGIDGVASGAAAMGVAAATIVLVVHSWKVNKAGVTIAAGLGAMKMFMPNLFKYPVILLPTFLTAIISAVPVAIWHISGTPNSGGFGLVGLVGPIAAMEAGLSFSLMLLTWFIIPIAGALFSMFLFETILKLYKKEVVFKFPPTETNR